MDLMNKKPTIIQGNNPKEYEPIHSAEDYVSEEDYLTAKEKWEKENYHTDKLRDSSQAQLPHEILEETNEQGFMKLRILQGLLEGKVVSFGKVSFQPTEDETIKLDYSYEIEGPDKYRPVPKVEACANAYPWGTKVSYTHLPTPPSGTVFGEESSPRIPSPPKS